jgi:SPP1 family predicted phage head-tail adaptor
VWGRLEPLKAVKKTFAGKREHNVTHEATIRARTDVTIGMRVSFDARIFQVHGFRTIEERGRWTVLTLEEGVAS